MDAWDGSIHDVQVVGLDAEGQEVPLTEEQEIAAVRSLVGGPRGLRGRGVGLEVGEPRAMGARQQLCQAPATRRGAAPGARALPQSSRAEPPPQRRDLAEPLQPWAPRGAAERGGGGLPGARRRPRPWPRCSAPWRRRRSCSPSWATPLRPSCCCGIGRWPPASPSWWVARVCSGGATPAACMRLRLPCCLGAARGAGPSPRQPGMLLRCRIGLARRAPLPARGSARRQHPEPA
jgi:hypothetical protein